MKIHMLLFKFICSLLLCIILSVSCKKSATGDDPPVVILSDSTNADTISNRLLFLKAEKIQGAIPTGPSTSNLKISFKDTLYVASNLKGPVKFLHEGTAQDVAGMFVQVKGRAGAASFYFDVPEVEQMKVNDTVSTILMGFNPVDILTGNVPAPPGGSTSFVFDIVMTPYDDNKQPIASATRPVKISRQKINENGTGGLCGLELPPGDEWRWDLSLIEDPSGNGKLSFYNDPKYVWGAGGQSITGCCINGVSSYNTVLNCESDPAKARRLLFPTFFQHMESSVKFFNDATYVHFSKQINVNPAPDRTNFCGGGQGQVDISQRNVTENGTWKITRVTPYKGDSLRLQLTKISSSGGIGLVNPGGYIRQLECNLLVLVRPDNEVLNRDFISFYSRINVSINGWYLFI